EQVRLRELLRRERGLGEPLALLGVALDRDLQAGEVRELRAELLQRGGDGAQPIRQRRAAPGPAAPQPRRLVPGEQLERRRAVLLGPEQIAEVVVGLAEAPLPARAPERRRPPLGRESVVELERPLVEA